MSFLKKLFNTKAEDPASQVEPPKQVEECDADGSNQPRPESHVQFTPLGTAERFRVTIVKAFLLDRGIFVAGFVEQGIVKLGDGAYLNSDGTIKEITIGAIDLKGPDQIQSVTEAKQGQKVGLWLQGLASKDDVHEGDELSGPRRPERSNNADSVPNASLFQLLIQVVGLVETKTHWQSTFADQSDIAFDVVNYGRLLFCYLIASDQHLPEQETNLFNDFWMEASGSKLPAEQIQGFVASSQDEAFRVLSEPPKFFRLLVAHDVQHRTNCTEVAFHALQIFVQFIVGVDGQITDEEANAAACVLARLSVYAQSHGVVVSIPETATPAEATNAAQPHSQSSDSLADLLKGLDALVGLAQVKEEVNGLVNLIKVRKLRQDRGIKCPPLSLHLVFSGNPGTGKTTVARLLGGIFKALGILSKGHLVEVDRAGLVAGYVGQTAIKVKEVTDKSLGGILFVDEAYSLASKSEQDFGREAVETLLKTMEDHREDFVVIAAGYTDKMEEFLNINPGLRSRFNKFIHFQDYSPDELLQIFCKMCADNGYEFTAEFRDKMHEILTIEFNLRGKDFANARTARNCFERVVATHSNRLANNPNPSDKDLVTFQNDDVNALAAPR